MDARPQLEPRIFAAGPEHIRLLARHRCEMFLEMGSLGASAYQDLFDRSIPFFERAIRDQTYFPFLASADEGSDAVIGGGGILVRPLMPRPTPDGRHVVEGEQALVLNIFVERDYRRQGVAQALMKHLLAWCRTRRIESIVLHASEAGRPLYEPFGFRPTNEMSLYLPFTANC